MNDQLWYREMGFSSNPFSIKPAAFNDDVIGFEDVLQMVVENVRSRGICCVSGPFGTGKSTIMKRLIREFGGNRKVIYYSMNRKERTMNFSGLLHGANGFLGRLFKIKPKDMILLLDEVQDMNRKDQRLLLDHYNAGDFKAVVLTTHDIGEVPLIDELKKAIGEYSFFLNNLHQDDAVRLIRKRIGNMSLLPDATIRSIYRINKNPRAFLQNCEDVCKWAVENNVRHVSAEDIEGALQA